MQADAAKQRIHQGVPDLLLCCLLLGFWKKRNTVLELRLLFREQSVYLTPDSWGDFHILLANTEIEEKS